MQSCDGADAAATSHTCRNTRNILVAQLSQGDPKPHRIFTVLLKCILA